MKIRLSHFLRRALLLALTMIPLHFAQAEDITYTNQVKQGSEAYGGVLDSPAEDDLSGKTNITFQNNSADATDSFGYGGAISVQGHTGPQQQLVISNNSGTVLFEQNKATTQSNHAAKGGAIYTDATAPISITGNQEVKFTDNSASATGNNADGGAISSLSDITISNNGDVTFSGNHTNTGKLVTSNATITDAFGVQYTAVIGQPPIQGGGAINVTGNLTIANNGNVLFEKNYEVVYNPDKETTSTYLSGIRLQGWESDSSSTTRHALNLSAAENKFIEIRDRVVVDRMAAGNFFSYNYHNQDMHLNQEYEGNKQKGTIRFTGKYTERDLKEAKGGVAGTAEEIKISRTSAITGKVYLHDGTLSVEDSAILLAEAVHIAAGSELSTLLSATNGVADVSLTAIQVNNQDTAATISADLIFEDGAGLTMRYGNISLDSHALTLGSNTLLNIGTINNPAEGDSIVLFTDVTSVNFESGALASNYFTGNIIGKETSLIFENNTVSLKGVTLLPEPTTGTLTLLALAGLALRRRRSAC